MINVKYESAASLMTDFDYSANIDQDRRNILDDIDGVVIKEELVFEESKFDE